MATITVYLNITLYYFGRFIVCLLSENIDLFTFYPNQCQPCPVCAIVVKKLYVITLFYYPTSNNECKETNKRERLLPSKSSRTHFSQTIAALLEL